MGYTHYWKFNKPSKAKGEAARIETLYQKAMRDCQKIALYYYKDNKGTEYSLSGYTAHSKLGQYGGLHINGRGRKAHEDFCMREHYSENEADFCKTARKPYDIVVVACLATIKYHLGDLFKVSSDGDYNEWVDGVSLANESLRRTANKIINPIPFDTSKDMRLVG